MKGKIMTVLENFINHQADPKLPGFLSNSIKKGYSSFNEFVKREPELQLYESRNVYGYLRHIFIDIILKRDAHNSGIDLKVNTREIPENGYTYLVIDHKNCIITVHKTSLKNSLPAKAVNRTLRSKINNGIPNIDLQLSLFENPPLEKEQIKTGQIYLMVTYGGSHYKLEYVNLGMPNDGVTRWLDIKNITNSLTTTEDVSETEQAQINLEFQNEVKRMLEREKKNGGQI